MNWMKYFYCFQKDQSNETIRHDRIKCLPLYYKLKVNNKN